MVTWAHTYHISHCEGSQNFEKWCHFIKIASGITHLDWHSNFLAIQSIIHTQQHGERNAVQHSFGIQCKLGCLPCRQWCKDRLHKLKL